MVKKFIPFKSTETKPRQRNRSFLYSLRMLNRWSVETAVKVPPPANSGGKGWQMKPYKESDFTDRQLSQIKQFNYYYLRNYPEPKPPIVDGYPDMMNKEYMKKYIEWEKRADLYRESFIEIKILKTRKLRGEKV